MSIEKNKAIVERWHEEVFNQRNADVIDEILDVNYVSYDTDAQGPEAAKKLFVDLLEGAPDLLLVIEDTIAEGDKVVTRWAWEQGGKRTFRGITIHRIAGGKIVEDWFCAEEIA